MSWGPLRSHTLQISTACIWIPNSLIIIKLRGERDTSGGSDVILRIK